MTEQQNQKQQAIDLLESRYRGMENVCEGIDLEQMIALMLEDMHAVDGIEWIAVDF